MYDSVCILYIITVYQRPCGSQLALSFELQLTGIVVGLQRLFGSEELQPQLLPLQGLQGLQSHATHHVII